MATKTTFDFNSETITNGFQKAFKAIQESKVSVISKTGKTWVNIPLLFALVIAIIFPFVTIATVILVVLSVIKIAIEREVEDSTNQQKTIELK